MTADDRAAIYVARGLAKLAALAAKTAAEAARQARENATKTTAGR